MKRKAKELKVGDCISVAGESVTITAIEHSDISKQGTKKTRIEAARKSGEKLVLIRPEDYPFDTA
jgi:translation elongation factor P/translation initiation factor 5A